MPNRTAGSPRLSGGQEIRLTPGSLLHRAVQSELINEQYTCNYELNPEYEPRLREAGLVITARGPQGEARAVELPGHPYYVGTLFQPQLSSAEGRPHPLILGFLAAARTARAAAAR